MTELIILDSSDESLKGLLPCDDLHCYNIPGASLNTHCNQCIAGKVFANLGPSHIDTDDLEPLWVLELIKPALIDSE